LKSCNRSDYYAIKLPRGQMFPHPSKSPHTTNLEIQLLNALTTGQRQQLGLEGYLPCGQIALEAMADACWQQLGGIADDLDKWRYLNQLHAMSKPLFFRLLAEHTSELLPFVYTPTIGKVAQQFSELINPINGIFIDPSMRGRVQEILARVLDGNAQVIVASNGGRVLGLGDQGIGGMAICRGKLALYSLFGGINPAAVLPLMIDLGTNNPELLNSPSYLGLKQARLSEAERDELLDEIVAAIHTLAPQVCLQWEDFGKTEARYIWKRYQDRHPSFNDDIQGTSAVVLAGLLTASARSKRPLLEQRFLIAGTGSAGLGIAERILDYAHSKGVSRQAMAQQIFLCGRKGLLKSNAGMSELELLLAKDRDVTTSTNLLDIIEDVHPTILIGVSGHGGLFTKECIQQMYRSCKQPIVFPLSNPTSCSEAIPSDILAWTEGMATIATGSPFSPVALAQRSVSISQCNNLYIFPSIGLAAQLCQPAHISDAMLTRAAEELSLITLEQRDHDELFLPMSSVYEATQRMALAVCQQAIEEGVAAAVSQEELKKRMHGLQWNPKKGAVCG